MHATKLAAGLALLVFTGLALAQEGGRGSTPPGTSQDGSSAAEGAIKGGSIQPGERSGMPDHAPAVKRCNELSGTLREQCLKEAESASGGITAPGGPPRPDPNVRDPREAPPPQNPR
jgi:hypothetical protein